MDVSAAEHQLSLPFFCPCKKRGAEVEVVIIYLFSEETVRLFFVSLLTVLTYVERVEFGT